MDELRKLSEKIKEDALAVFIQKTGDAFVELEAAVGNLPEATVSQWNAQLKGIIKVVNNII